MSESVIVAGAITLAVIGAVNTVLMFEVLGRRGGPDTFKSIHRWLGRVFLVLFTVLFVYMLPRIAFLANIPVNFLVHGFLSMIVFILLIGKFLVVRRYKVYMPSLALLGVYIMLITILIVMSSAGIEVFKRLPHSL